MNWQLLSIVVGIIVGFFAILGAVISYVVAMNKMAFFAGQFLAKIDNISISFSNFEKAFEKHMEDEKKMCDAMWRKIDTQGDTLIEHGQRIGFIEKSFVK